MTEFSRDQLMANVEAFRANREAAFEKIFAEICDQLTTESRKKGVQEVRVELGSRCATNGEDVLALREYLAQKFDHLHGFVTNKFSCNSNRCSCDMTKFCAVFISVRFQ